MKKICATVAANQHMTMERIVWLAKNIYSMKGGI